LVANAIMRSLARALGGRMKSVIVQVARREASRFMRHLRERFKEGLAPPAAPAPRTLEPPPSPATAASPAETPLAPPEATVPAPAPKARSPAKRPHSAKPSPKRAAAKKSARAGETIGTVDINAASRAELIALPGIGPSRADAIMNGRPYKKPVELVRRRILPDSLFTTLRERLRTD
jgi:DNA uptake protein ComE-like DNA-binding protein